MDRRSALLPSGPTPALADEGREQEPSAVFRYGFAIAITLVALLVKLALGPVILPSLYVPFYGAVLLSAWIGGVGPGVLVAALSFGLGQFLIAPALPAPANAQLAMTRDVLFLAVAIGLSWGMAALHGSRRRMAAMLRAGRDELEARVALRTSELRAANRLLTESEQKFRTLAETAPFATVIFQGSVVRYVNPAAAAITGYTREELTAMPFWNVVHPESRELIRQRGLARQRGEPLPPNDETRIVTKAGETRWVDFSSAMIDFEGGRAVLGTAFDVTERKRSEETLRHSETLLRDQATWLQSILNSLGEAVVVADEKGKLLYFNPIAEQLHGRGLSDVAPEDWAREYGVYFPDGTLVSPAQMPLAQALRGLTTTPNQEFAIRVPWQDTVLPVSVTATPLVSAEGVLRGGVVVYRDIRDIKRAEALLRQNEARLKEAERLAHVGAWEWDIATDEAVWSDEQFRIFGLEPRAGSPGYDEFLQLIVAEDRDVVEQAIRDALGAARPFDVECRIQRPDNEIRYVHSRGTVVRDAAGSPMRLVGTVLDITEQKRSESLLERRVEQRTAELQEANRALREEIRQRQQAEEALRDSEERFRGTFEQAAVGVAMVGANGRWLLVNDRICEILGYTREELMERTFRDITCAEDLDESVRAVREMVTGQVRSFVIEKRYVRKDGSLLWGSMTGSAVRDRDGAFKYGVAVVQDISARKLAEGEVRATEERLRRLVEHLPAITYVLALDAAQTTLYVSPQVETTLGFSAEKWMADPDLWNRQLHPYDRKRVIAEVAASHATGEPFSSEYRMYTNAGKLVWFHDEAAVIRDEKGTMLFSQGVMIDITARKHAEEELDAVNQRTRYILEEITDGFYSLDHAGRFTYLNPSALQLFERSADELLGTNIWDAFPEGIGSAFELQYQRLMAERVAVEVEAYYGPRNRWFRAHGYPTQQGASVLFEDVTERHDREATALSDILRALNAELNVAAAFAGVATALRVLTECDRSNLIFFDRDYEEATVIALSDARRDLGPGARLRMGDIPAATNVMAGRAHIVMDLAEEPQSAIVRTTYSEGFRSLVCLPLRGTEQILGMLTLAWREVEGLNHAQLPLLHQIADAVALAAEKSRLFDEVHTGRERLEALSRRLLEVQESERQHIARELHDEIGQALTALKLALNSVTGVSVAGTADRLAEARGHVNELLARVRRLALDLRPAMLDDLGLLPALLWLFERYSATVGVQVNFEHRGIERRFNSEIETAAYRIVQEALTNVARHANVAQVTVRAWTEPNSLSVQIVDLGRGFDADAAVAAGLNSGVTGMRERALLLGGHFSVESAGGKGTRVNAELPLGETASEVTLCR